MWENAVLFVDSWKNDEDFKKDFSKAIKEGREELFYRAHGIHLPPDEAKKLLMNILMEAQIESGELSDEELDNISGGFTCFELCVEFTGSHSECTTYCG